MRSLCGFEREGEARSGLALPQDDLLLFLLLSLSLLLQLHSLLMDLSLLLHYAQLILSLVNTKTRRDEHTSKVETEPRNTCTFTGCFA